MTEETISRAYLEGPPEPTPRTQLNLTFFHNYDMLKTIFDVNKVKNWPFDLERSSKVKVTKIAPTESKNHKKSSDDEYELCRYLR